MMSSQSTDLSQFLPKAPEDLTEMGLLRRATLLAEAFSGRLPSETEIADMTHHLGVEIATTVFLKCVQATPDHGAFFQQVRAIDLSSVANQSPQRVAFEVVIVASNLLVSAHPWGAHAETWRGWARSLGFTTEVIETNANASVSENARTIADFLEHNHHPNRILITYGQGASEFRFLLQKRQPFSKSVKKTFVGLQAWINVCGAVHGCGSSRIFTENPLRRWLKQTEMRMAGRNPKALYETSTDFALWTQPLVLPKGLVAVNLVGAPLISQVPAGLRTTYLKLAQKGPNDGAVGIHEALALPGFTLPIAGMSHRAESGKLEPVLKRVLVGLANSLIHDVSENQWGDDRRI